MRVLLRGYYGQGNFGDDVLLKVAYGLLRGRLTGAEIAVLCEPGAGDYLPRLLGGPCRIVRPGCREAFDLVVHGGGGVFFDFEARGAADRAVNALIAALGYRRFVALETALRAAAGRRRVAARHRIGWGIGVGTFAPGSRRLRDAVHALTGFDSLMVRDAASLDNLARLGLGAGAVHGADLAFLSGTWAPVPAPPPRRGGRPRVGVVLRDWAARPGHLAAIAAGLPALEAEADVTFHVFDAARDAGVIALANGRELRVWRPGETALGAFCRGLAAEDVLVTSRAHGAICGAVLGRPALLVEIEPKLRAVHGMLPGATRILPAEAAPADWLPEIARLRALPGAVIAAEVARNRARAAGHVAASLRAFAPVEAGPREAAA